MDYERGMKYSYEKISPDSEGKTHFRISDPFDNRIATCYQEENAKIVVKALNGDRMPAEPFSVRSNAVCHSIWDNRFECSVAQVADKKYADLVATALNYYYRFYLGPEGKNKA